MVDGISNALILLMAGCNFGLHSSCDANHKGVDALNPPLVNADFSVVRAMYR